MRHIFIAGEIGEQVIISGTDAHHLSHVLRLRQGDTVVVVDSRRKAAEMQVVSFDIGMVSLRFCRFLAIDTESPLHIILAQCLPKGDKMEYIVQKAVELGTAAIQPLHSSNCVTYYEAGKAKKRQAKWQRIALEASKQSGRTAVPMVYPVQELSDWLADWQNFCPDKRLLFFYENERQTRLADIAGESMPDGGYVVLIGPEGGFSSAESQLLQQHGAIALSLGPRILRTETASLAAISILQSLVGDM